MRLIVDHLTKMIGSNEVLTDISFNVGPGEVQGLAGVNGSGKTMLMRAVLGLIAPTAGSVLIDGKKLGSELPFPPSAGFLIEAPAFLNGRTGFDNLALLARPRGCLNEKAIAQLLNDVGLDPADRRTFKKYSLGMKQRLGIAAAIMGSPDLIVLDEPTNALDTSGIDMVQQMVEREKARGATILLASHDAAVLARLSDSVLHLAEGHVDEGMMNGVSHES
ncbi:ATP-binding cassette domain-containing protein [Collinsella tanakaei]|uniref:ATP-binding cassette domain-containing protein n=1 Tax=Collinsella tanakaei TaxID=626935 RepID=UPI002F91F5E2